MQIRINEKRVHKVINETVNGLNVSVLLDSSVNNQDIADTQYMTGVGFDAANVTIDVKLMRKGRIYNMISSNLAILAHYNTLLMGGSMWTKGIVTKKKGAAEKQSVVRSLFIPFFGHHNIKGSDEMVITATVNRDAFNSGVDSTTSSILVTPNQSIGVETAIYRFHEHAIQATQNNEFVNLGDNVVRVALMSFEKDQYKSVFRSASLSSDRLDWTINEHELILKHWQMFPYNVADNLLGNLSLEAQKEYYPNSFVIHDRDEIDQSKVQFNMNSQNVQASQNYVCWTSFITSREILSKARNMAEKHAKESIDKVPLEA